MEDFNIPSAERVALLERLQEAIGGAPPYFWAACQICDLESLKKLVSLDPANVGLIAGYAYTMILHCKQNNLDLYLSTNVLQGLRARRPSRVVLLQRKHLPPDSARPLLLLLLLPHLLLAPHQLNDGRLPVYLKEVYNRYLEISTSGI